MAGVRPAIQSLTILVSERPAGTNIDGFLTESANIASLGGQERAFYTRMVNDLEGFCQEPFPKRVKTRL